MDEEESNNTGGKREESNNIFNTNLGDTVAACISFVCACARACRLTMQSVYVCLCALKEVTDLGNPEYGPSAQHVCRNCDQQGECSYTEKEMPWQLLQKKITNGKKRWGEKYLFLPVDKNSGKTWLMGRKLLHQYILLTYSDMSV